MGVGEPLIDKLTELGWNGQWGKMEKNMPNGIVAKQGDEEWKIDRKYLVDRFGWLYGESL